MASAALGRLPQSMGILAIVLLVRATTGSYAVAGAVTAAAAIAGAAGAPVLGRLVDRLGATRVLLVAAAFNAGSLTALLVAARADAPTPVLLCLAAAQGAATPPLEACMARAWKDLTAGGPDLETAFALEAITREVLVIVGPLAVGLLVGIWSPDAAIVAVITLRLGGTTAFGLSHRSRAEPPAAPPAGRRGALGVPGLRTFVLAAFAIGLAFGALQIAIPAFAEDHGSRAQAGPLFACWALGSLVAGLWYGSRQWRAPAERRYSRAVALVPLAILPLALAGSAPTMAVLMLFAGAPIAPVFSTAYTLIDRLAPEGAVAEAFTLYGGALALGAAAGAGSAGALVSAAGTGWTIVAAAAAAALATPIVATRRATLRPAVAT